MSTDRPQPAGAWWCTAPGLLLIAVIGVALGYLILQHRIHVLAVLPYLLLLACPLMHLFHGRHGHGHARHGRGADASRGGPS
jgi:hypothetical protein